MRQHLFVVMNRASLKYNYKSHKCSSGRIVRATGKIVSLITDGSVLLLEVLQIFAYINIGKVPTGVEKAIRCLADDSDDKIFKLLIIPPPADDKFADF